MKLPRASADDRLVARIRRLAREIGYDRHPACEWVDELQDVVALAAVSENRDVRRASRALAATLNPR